MLFLFFLVIAVFYVLERVGLVGPLLGLTVTGVLCYLFRVAFREEPQVRRNIFIALCLTFFYIIFMILLQQSGGALNLFTDEFVDRTLWGVKIETGMFQSVEPLALVILSPFYSWIWTRFFTKENKLSDGIKFCLGLLLISLSFGLMALAMFYVNHAGLISMHWINITYVLQAAGELFIGPIGLSMISRLIPQYMMGLYMGVWVLGLAIANFVAAKIGAYITPSIAQLGTIGESVHAYQYAFIELAILGGLSAILLLSLTSKLRG